MMNVVNNRMHYSSVRNGIIPFDKADFLESLVCGTQYYQTQQSDFFEWFLKQRNSVTVDIRKIPFHQLRNWYFHPETGNICHTSGKFFTIQGIDISTNHGAKTHWEQPIINQPEVGMLGIIAKKINGILHFLMQAKIEPGNINYVQLSPTLQATRSNCSRIHGGNKPLYLDYFTGESDAKIRVLVDQLQSEQGARFLKKRNRNIIIEVLDELPIYDNFIWLTLGQIKTLMRYDNMVNMDTRTVISSISYGHNVQKDFKCAEAIDEAMLASATDLSKASLDLDHHIAWITRLKTLYELDVHSIPLNQVAGWIRNDHEIYHGERKYFRIMAVDVCIGNREVKEWSQPIVQSVQEGIIGFLVKKTNGVYHFLVQAKVEAGNFDILELAPTVQCLTGNYRKGFNEYEVPFLEYFLNAEPGQILFKTLQSEEGGRFFREQNLNIIVEVGDEFPIEPLPQQYAWMTLGQLMEFIRYNNYLNIQARSLLSAIELRIEQTTGK
ncbi:MAG: NDP-hexose 2,3-dehydratase family protein [Desulfobacterales bacterium]